MLLVDESMNPNESESQAYNSKVLLVDFDKILQLAEVVGARHFDEDIMNNLAKQARSEYARMIPRLPKLEGKNSPFKDLMIQSFHTIAFYKACRDRGVEGRQFGELMYEMAEAQMESVSWIKKRLGRHMAFARSFRESWKEAMSESQKREVSMNWVGEFVEGNRESSEWGFNFMECGFLKLAREYDCEEIAPYVCLSDFARMRGFGVGFKRTQTLAMGHPRCDFRFSKDYVTPRGWPPEKLDEVKNSPLKDRIL